MKFCCSMNEFIKKIKVVELVVRGQWKRKCNNDNFVVLHCLYVIYYVYYI